MPDDDRLPATPPSCDAAPDVRRTHPWRAFWTKALPAFAVAVCLLLLIPLDGEGEAPPVRVLLVDGIGVAAVMTLAVWLAVRLDLRLSHQVAWYAVAFNVLVVAVKLVLAPHAIYQVNKALPFTTDLTLDTPEGAVAAALLVFAVYALVLRVVYLLARARLGRRTGVLNGPRLWPSHGGRLALFAVAGLVVAVVGTGGMALLAAVIVGAPGLQYLDFVFSSSVSVVVAVSLACAVWLASRAFRAAEERAVALGNAAVLTSLFWVCLGFLALYQVLWVVYVLALTSVWPLRVVTPK